MTRAALLLMTATMAFGCGGSARQLARFGDDVAFLRRHTSVIVLSDREGRAKVALAPGYQGRVMTSTADGDAGGSFGYLHRAAISSKQRAPHITVLGGEDRFWLGPEGGQFSIYFPAGAPFDLEHWQVPEPIDWGGWEVVEQQADRAHFREAMSLTNYAGFHFELRADRTVRLLGPAELGPLLAGAPGPQTRAVAYESVNAITNTGAEPWRRETGLLSVWILGMFNPSPATTVVIPFAPGPEGERGRIVNDGYFGAIAPDRLVVRDRVLFFRGDGEARGKIGMPRSRAMPVLGSWDQDHRILTIVQFTLPQGAVDYVNSMWEVQRDPFRGDVANSYNDGPPSPGAPPLGPFYELESSSPAAALAPGQTLTHVHRTMHLTGPDAELDAIARRVLGVGLAEIEDALP